MTAAQRALVDSVADLDGWHVREHGQIRRDVPGNGKCDCPWTAARYLVQAELGFSSMSAIWDAADNAPGHDKELRDYMMERLVGK